MLELRIHFSAEELWDTFDALYLTNNDFVQKVLKRDLKEQKPLKEAYHEKYLPENIQYIESRSMSLDYDNNQIEVTKQTCS